jgi:hypothetical protein
MVLRLTKDALVRSADTLPLSSRPPSNCSRDVDRAVAGGGRTVVVVVVIVLAVAGVELRERGGNMPIDESARVDPPVDTFNSVDSRAPARSRTSKPRAAGLEHRAAGDLNNLGGSTALLADPGGVSNGVEVVDFDQFEKEVMKRHVSRDAC